MTRREGIADFVVGTIPLAFQPGMQLLAARGQIRVEERVDARRRRISLRRAAYAQRSLS